MLRIPSKQGGCRRKIFSCQSPRSSEIMAARSCHNNILGPTVRCAPCSCAAAPWGCEKCATAVRTDVGGKLREGLRKGESSRKRAGIGPQLGHQPHKVDSVRSPSSRSRSSGGKCPFRCTLLCGLPTARRLPRAAATRCGCGTPRAGRRRAPCG